MSILIFTISGMITIISPAAAESESDRPAARSESPLVLAV